MKCLVLILLSSLVATVAFAQGKDFHDQTLTGKDFTGANLDGADFSDATFKDCIFTRASLKAAIFKDTIGLINASDADLTGADLRGVSGGLWVKNANLNKANLEGLDCAQLSLYRTTFKEANLRNTKNWLAVDGCDFYKADVRGANLRAMRVVSGSGPLSEIRFKGAVYDESTSWPDGFDPVAAGAVLLTIPAGAAAK